jgi:hypothetical protein
MTRRLAPSNGLYSIDPFDPFAQPAKRTQGYDALVTIAGLGGTGAFLAEDLARLFSVHFGWHIRLHLVDHDVVEEHNAERQAFAKRDRNKHKAQVVAERLVRQFPIEVSLSLAPYDHRRDAPRPHHGEPPPRLSLLIGAVDNAAARHELARTFEPPSYGAGPVWYLDLGNGAASGQLYLGNALDADQLRGAFDDETHTCRALPAPSVQAPELLEAATIPLPAPDADCAQAQVAGDQEPFVNRAIAALGLAVITRLCQRRLTWRASFFDLEVGTLHYTHVDQHDVARLVGMRAHSLLRRSSRLAIRSA